KRSNCANKQFRHGTVFLFSLCLDFLLLEVRVMFRERSPRDRAPLNRGKASQVQCGAWLHCGLRPDSPLTIAQNPSSVADPTSVKLQLLVVGVISRRGQRTDSLRCLSQWPSSAYWQWRDARQNRRLPNEAVGGGGRHLFSDMVAQRRGNRERLRYWLVSVRY